MSIYYICQKSNFYNLTEKKSFKIYIILFSIFLVSANSLFTKLYIYIYIIIIILLFTNYFGEVTEINYTGDIARFRLSATTALDYSIYFTL